jgi:FkbM family methyltransferase
MEVFKAIARRALRRVGLDQIRHPSFSDLMRHEGIETVLDVGANEGHFGREIRENGYKGTIVSFEPVSTVFESLCTRARSDLSWEVYNIALGEADEERSISVSKASVFSSFKRPTAYTAARFKDSHEVRHQTVPVRRLDSFLALHPEYLRNPYLKIDTQGFEKEVLLGAGSLLPTFKAVQAELAVRPLYQGQPSWLELVEWMADQGFGVGMAKAGGYDARIMRTLELDIVFVRRE